jgi:hypothetical protein
MKKDGYYGMHLRIFIESIVCWKYKYPQSFARSSVILQYNKYTWEIKEGLFFCYERKFFLLLKCTDAYDNCTKLILATVYRDKNDRGYVSNTMISHEMKLRLAENQEDCTRFLTMIDMGIISHRITRQEVLNK